MPTASLFAGTRFSSAPRSSTIKVCVFASVIIDGCVTFTELTPHKLYWVPILLRPAHFPPTLPFPQKNTRRLRLQRGPVGVRRTVLRDLRGGHSLWGQQYRRDSHIQKGAFNFLFVLVAMMHIQTLHLAGFCHCLFVISWLHAGNETSCLPYMYPSSALSHAHTDLELPSGRLALYGQDPKVSEGPADRVA